MFSGLVVLFAYIKNLKLLSPRGLQLKVPSLFKISENPHFRLKGDIVGWLNVVRLKMLWVCRDLLELILSLLLVIGKCGDYGLLFACDILFWVFLYFFTHSI